ncbi:MAG TPA: hypothetical protein HA362_04280 [Nanoarchaeota archaeon]|nr:hypothetical protein [Nanoarchaeota archaeon]
MFIKIVEILGKLICLYAYIISVISSSENVRKLNRAFQDLKEGRYRVR